VELDCTKTEFLVVNTSDFPSKYNDKQDHLMSQTLHLQLIKSGVVTLEKQDKIEMKDLAGLRIDKVACSTKY